MSVQITADGPLAKALQSVVSPKLVELSWSSGLQDDTLTEYIILMLVNGKRQDEISNELARDLLALSPEDQSAAEFASWLFDQVEILDAQINGTAPATSESTAPLQQDIQMDGISIEQSTADPTEKPM
jgi:nuclear polyadenylated RNA-binding protein NAB2